MRQRPRGRTHKDRIAAQTCRPGLADPALGVPDWEQAACPPAPDSAGRAKAKAGALGGTAVRPHPPPPPRRPGWGQEARLVGFLSFREFLLLINVDLQLIPLTVFTFLSYTFFK